MSTSVALLPPVKSKNAARTVKTAKPKKPSTTPVDHILSVIEDIRAIGRVDNTQENVLTREMFASRVGSAIRLLRIHWAMQQKQLANALNLTQSQLSNYELGKNLPDIHMLYQLAQALKVSLSDFLRLADIN